MSIALQLETTSTKNVKQVAHGVDLALHGITRQLQITHTNHLQNIGRHVKQCSKETRGEHANPSDASTRVPAYIAQSTTRSLWGPQCKAQDVNVRDKEVAACHGAYSPVLEPRGRLGIAPPAQDLRGRMCENHTLPRPLFVTKNHQ